jgi:lipopolysaccharide biosynthesis regulator YciM
MGLLDVIRDAVTPKRRSFGGKAEKCPKCKQPITLEMERCPKCGTHIASMFRIECPMCKEQNAIDAKFCKKCAYSFEKPASSGNRVRYTCPICNFEADYYMLSCPSCGTKFIS